MPGKCKFQELWLQNEQFKDWVLKVDDRKAKCKVCKTTIELSNMGEGALRSHANSKKHATCMKPTGASSSAQVPITALLQPPHIAPREPQSANEAAPTPSSDGSVRHSGARLGLTPAKTLEAEILWCLKLTESHWSYKSSEQSGM